MIFPIFETYEALGSYIEDPEDWRKMMHLEALLKETLQALRVQILKEK
jgi:hypothetical protein